MVLSLFKQKPIISVLLLKDSCFKNKKTEKKPQISYLECRLRRLEYKLKKVKRHSKKVFKRYERNASAEKKCYAGGKHRKSNIKRRVASSCDDTNESDTCDKEIAVCGDSSSNKNSAIELECSRIKNLSFTEEVPNIIDKQEKNICMQEKEYNHKEEQSSEKETNNSADENTCGNQVEKDDSYPKMKESKKIHKCASKCERKELKRKQKVERKCQKYKQMVAGTCEGSSEVYAISGVEESEISDISTKDLSKLLVLKTKNMLTRKQRSLSGVLRDCYEKYICDSKNYTAKDENDVSSQKGLKTSCSSVYLSNNNKTSTTCMVETKLKDKLLVSDSESNTQVTESLNLSGENQICSKIHLPKPCSTKSIQHFISKQKVLAQKSVTSQQSVKISLEEVNPKNLGNQNKEIFNAHSPEHSCHTLFNNTISNQDDGKKEQDKSIKKKASNIYINHKNQNNSSNPCELSKSDESRSIRSLTKSRSKDKKLSSLKTTPSKANTCSKDSLHNCRVLAPNTCLLYEETLSKTEHTSNRTDAENCESNQIVKTDSLEDMQVRNSSENKMFVNNISSKSVPFPEQNYENRTVTLNDQNLILCQNISSNTSHTQILENPKINETETVNNKDNCKQTSKQATIKSKGSKSGMDSESVANSKLFIYHHETSTSISKHLKKNEPSFDKAVRRDESKSSLNQSTNLFSSDRVKFKTKSNISHLSEICQPKGSFASGKSIVRSSDKDLLDENCNYSNHATKGLTLNKIENLDTNLINNGEKSFKRSVSMAISEKSNSSPEPSCQEKNESNDTFNSNKFSRKSSFSIHHLSSEIRASNEQLQKSELNQSDSVKQTDNVNEQLNKYCDSKSIEELVLVSQKENSDDILNKLSDESTKSIESVKTLSDSNSLNVQVIDQLKLSNDKAVFVIKSEISTQTPLWEKQPEYKAEVVNNGGKNEKQLSEMNIDKTIASEHGIKAKSQISTQTISDIFEPGPSVQSPVQEISSSTNMEQIFTVNTLQKNIDQKSFMSSNELNLIFEDLINNSFKQATEATQTDSFNINSSVLNDRKELPSTTFSIHSSQKMLALKNKRTQNISSRNKNLYQEMTDTMTKRSLHSLPNFKSTKENNKRIELSAKQLEDSKRNKKANKIVSETKITRPTKVNDYLVIHCKKCSEISIAKIIEKKDAGSKESKQ